MGQLYSKKCSNCNSIASYEKIVISDFIPICKCNHLIFQNCVPLIFNEKVYIYNKCTCNHSITFETNLQKNISENRDILEFLKEMPKVEFRDLILNEKMKNNFTLYFYACDNCINYRPWAYEKMSKIL